MGPINSITTLPTQEELDQLPPAALEVLAVAGGGLHLADLSPMPPEGEQRQQFIQPIIQLLDMDDELIPSDDFRWFLVDGQSLDNLAGGSEYYLAESIFDLVFQGGGTPPYLETSYYAVVWDPEGKPYDYAMSIGLGEEFTDIYRTLDMIDLARNNNHLHGPCTTPYPDDPAPDNPNIEMVSIIDELVTFPDDFPPLPFPLQ
jgi:hypothetical protein